MCCERGQVERKIYIYTLKLSALQRQPAPSLFLKISLWCIQFTSYSHTPHPLNNVERCPWTNIPIASCWSETSAQSGNTATSHTVTVWTSSLSNANPAREHFVSTIAPRRPIPVPTRENGLPNGADESFSAPGLDRPPPAEHFQLPPVERWEQLPVPAPTRNVKPQSTLPAPPASSAPPVVEHTASPTVYKTPTPAPPSPLSPSLAQNPRQPSRTMRNPPLPSSNPGPPRNHLKHRHPSPLP